MDLLFDLMVYWENDSFVNKLRLLRAIISLIMYNVSIATIEIILQNRVDFERIYHDLICKYTFMPKNSSKFRREELKKKLHILWHLAN